MRRATKRAWGLVTMLVMTGYLASASAPLLPMPGVEERFSDWVTTNNQRVVQALPGETPAPDSELGQQLLALASAEPDQSAELPPAGDDTSPPTGGTQDGAPAVAQAIQTPVPVRSDIYYQSDTLTISLTQHSDGNIVYFVADIQIADPSQLTYAFSRDSFGGARESVSDIADRNAAVLAINGDFCGFHRSGVIIRGGELFRKQNSTRHLLIVDKNGDMSALVDRREKQGLVANRLMNEGVLHTFEFGPLLVENGQAVTLPKSFFIRTPKDFVEPRTAIGQIGPLHYIAMVVDGRSAGYSEGASLGKLQELMLRHGAVFAFNLDGGGSATMYYQGEVINHPSSGAERSVSDIVMFVD